MPYGRSPDRHRWDPVSQGENRGTNKARTCVDCGLKTKGQRSAWVLELPESAEIVVSLSMPPCPVNPDKPGAVSIVRELVRLYDAAGWSPDGPAGYMAPGAAQALVLELGKLVARARAVRLDG
jgi:hypothetical protein